VKVEEWAKDVNEHDAAWVKGEEQWIKRKKKLLKKTCPYKSTPGPCTAASSAA
jgi:hypothetical protein